MAILMSPRKFRKEFLDRLLKLHWRQWTALGVAGTETPERHWIIDLEALLVSTYTIGLKDRRLFNGMLEWVQKNGFWINNARLKRIGSYFQVKTPAKEEFLLSHQDFTLLLDTIRRKTQHRKIISEYSKIIRSFRPRGIVTKPRLISSHVLLQLSFRALCGIDARAEILLYLLTHECGNSNSIARETFHNQRNVYKILKRFSEVGIVTIYRKTRAKDYSLNRKKVLLRTLGINKLPKYLNWTRLFRTLDLLLKVIFRPECEDTYLLSSLFRDHADKMREIGHWLNVDVPDPELYLGEKYFLPVAQSFLRVLDRLINPD